MVALNAGGRALLIGYRLVDLHLCAGVTHQELPVALEIGEIAGMGRLVAGQHRLVLGDLGLDVAIIEREEQVAGLDELPVGDVLRHDLAVDAGAHEHARRRLDEADGVLAHREVGLHGGSGDDRDRSALAPPAAGRARSLRRTRMPIPGSTGCKADGNDADDQS